MKYKLKSFLVTGLSLSLSLSTSLSASSPQPVTAVDPVLGPPATGGGDSWGPILTPDGRYVLFASSANNLVSGSNGISQPSVPPKFNVFLRDRTNRTTVLVSPNVSGTGGGNGDSFPTALSTNGQYALFESSADNLVTDDANNAADVFLRDLVNNTTTLVSVSTNSQSGNGSSQSSTMTPDARYVAFSSTASNLVVGDVNGIADIFVRDMLAGTTTLASPNATKVANSNSRSDAPAITPDGRYVAFLSTAAGMVPGASTAGDVYVRDLIGLTTVDVSTAARGSSTTLFFLSHVISDDGQYAVFESGSPTRLTGKLFRYNLSTEHLDVVASNFQTVSSLTMEFRNLDITPDGRFVCYVGSTNSGTSSVVYLWDGQSNSTTLVSAQPGLPVESNTLCALPSISANGQFITYLGFLLDVTSNTTTTTHLHLWNAATASNTIVDVEPGGQVSFDTFMSHPSITPDGRFIAFDATDSNLGGDPRPAYYNVYLSDQSTNTIETVSLRQSNLPSATARVLSIQPRFSLSSNGQYVAYSCLTNGIANNSTNNYRSIFVSDLLHGSNIEVGLGTNGEANFDRNATDPVVSADGRFVAFIGENNLFVRDLQSGTTTLALTNILSSTAPALDAGLRHGICVTGYDTSGYIVYYVTLESNAASLIANNIGSDPGTVAITPDGRYAAWCGKSVVLWDGFSSNVVYSNNLTILTSPYYSVTSVALSPDGNRLAYTTNGVLYAVDRAANTTVNLATGVTANRGALQFTGDSRYLVYVTSEPIAPNDTNAVNDVYRYDFALNTNQLISQNASGVVGNGASDSSATSSDGRFVAYRSSASNLVAGVASPYSQIYLFDSRTGTTSLASASALTGGPANNRSLAPVFSGDSTTLVFQSWACDLLANDFSGSASIVALTVAVYPPALIGAIQITPPGVPVIAWPASAGTNFQLQYKDDLSDPSWLPVSGGVTITSNTASTTDLSPSQQQRFYRIQSN